MSVWRGLRAAGKSILYKKGAVILRETVIANRVSKVALGAIFVAMGVALPQIFHYFGPELGRIFLPMHLPAFLAGFILGPFYGAAVGAVTPLLSFAVTGMPPFFPTLPSMLVELAAYGLFSGIFYRKLRLPLAAAMAAAMLSGRAAMLLCLFFMAFVLNAPVSPLESVASSFVAGMPGMAGQIAAVFCVWFALGRGKIRRDAD